MFQHPLVTTGWKACMQDCKAYKESFFHQFTYLKDMMCNSGFPHTVLNVKGPTSISMKAAGNN